MRSRKEIAAEDLEPRANASGMVHVFYGPEAAYSMPGNRSICQRQHIEGTVPQEHDIGAFIEVLGVIVGKVVCCYCLQRMAKYVLEIEAEEKYEEKES